MSWFHGCGAVAVVTALLTLSSSALAEGRGAIGGALDAGHGALGVGDNRLGLSAWYRPKPAFAVGLSYSELFVDNGDTGGLPAVYGAKLVEAFVDGRLPSDSLLGGFGRVAVGVASLAVDDRADGLRRRTPALDFELGPELRLFFSPPRDSARSALFFRVRGTFTFIPVDRDLQPETPGDGAFFGFGLALGFEG